MAKNSSLNAASVAKQDEFYTQYKDIQNELNHYEKHFKDKTVLCNCSGAVYNADAEGPVYGTSAWRYYEY